MFSSKVSLYKYKTVVEQRGQREENNEKLIHLKETSAASEMELAPVKNNGRTMVEHFNSSKKTKTCMNR